MQTQSARYCLLAILSASCSFGLAPAAVTGQTKPAEPIAKPTDKATNLIQGVGSFAVANCHGSGRGGMLRAGPRHTQSGRPKIRMPRRIRCCSTRAGPKWPSYWGTERMGGEPPHQAMLCLKCHSLEYRAHDKLLPTALLVDLAWGANCDGAAAERRHAALSGCMEDAQAGRQSQAGLYRSEDAVQRVPRPASIAHIGSTSKTSITI